MDDAEARFKDPTVSHPKFKKWQYLLDFILDRKAEKSVKKLPTFEQQMGLAERLTPDELAFNGYFEMRDSNPNYQPDTNWYQKTGTKWWKEEVNKIVSLPDYIDQPSGDLITGDYIEELNEQSAYWSHLVDTFDQAIKLYCKKWDVSDRDIEFVPEVYAGGQTGASYFKVNCMESSLYYYFFAFNGNEQAMEKMQFHLNKDDALFLAEVVSRYKYEDGLSPYSATVQRLLNEKELQEDPDFEYVAGEVILPKRGIVIRDTEAPLISECTDAFFKEKRFTVVAEETKNAYRAAIQNAIDIWGDLPIDQVTNAHFTVLLEAWEKPHWGLLPRKKPYDKKPLKSGSMQAIGSKIVSFFNYVKIYNHPTTGKPFVAHNPFENVGYVGYGIDAKLDSSLDGHQPYDNQQLYKLFDLTAGRGRPMPDHETLWVKILLATGMRSTEASSLIWSQIKTEKFGTSTVTYADLRNNPTKGQAAHPELAPVKREASRRIVVFPDVIKLPPRPADLSARLFPQWKADPTSNKAIMPTRLKDRWYIQVRRRGYSDKDTGLAVEYIENKKNWHSLRKNWANFARTQEETEIKATGKELDIMGGWEQPKAQKSERDKYLKRSEVSIERMYEITNAIQHDWFDTVKRAEYLKRFPFDRTKPKTPE